MVMCKEVKLLRVSCARDHHCCHDFEQLFDLDIIISPLQCLQIHKRYYLQQNINKRDVLPKHYLPFTDNRPQPAAFLQWVGDFDILCPCDQSIQELLCYFLL